MANYRLIGHDSAPKDLVAKITGRAKYAEDFRAEGMAFAKLLLSPIPHARVRSIDVSRALALEGVYGVLTADDLPPPEAPQERALTNEPVYEGEPILALAAVDEATAAEAIELIDLDLEPLPFVLNPLDALRPGGPSARIGTNAYKARDLVDHRWSQDVFDAAGPDQIPLGEPTEEWHMGDVEAELAAADLVIEETLYHQSQTHHPMEPRTCMAYWQNGKVYVHHSTQSAAISRSALARRLDMPLEDVITIAEYCGGGFGGKISGSVIEDVPVRLSQKIGRPVMLRVTRTEENSIGRARTGLLGHVKFGFRRDGKMTACDLYLIQDNGPYGRQGDFFTAADVVALTYQPTAMRFRGVAVLTNTPPRSAQRGPGGVQINAMVEPVIDRAARELNIDRVEIRRINAPQNGSVFGEESIPVTSAFVRESLDQGAQLFNWAERSQRSGQRNGSKVTGVSAVIAGFHGGSSGWDGLLVIRPDGKLYIHQGVGNLGTHSVMDTARTAAEILNQEWDNTEVVWGHASRHLPWSSSQSGSQTTHAHTRANHAVGTAMLALIQELAALELGGAPSSYRVSPGRVSGAGGSMSFAQLAEAAIRRGGKFSGGEMPEDLNEMTKQSVTALAGQGLICAAKDNYRHEGETWSFVAGFAEVTVDVETGAVEIVDYTAVTDCGTVVNPRNLVAQMQSGSVQGFGVALTQKWAIDPEWGTSMAKRLYTAKPPTILDVPLEMAGGYVNLPDPQNPVGAKGIGEPPQGAGAAAILCAIQDAMGGVYPGHTPMTPDKVLSLLENDCFPCGRLETHV